MATTKTALQVVNLVMRNLRKSQVTTFTADYPLLILELVNQAKREIEDAADWSHLRGDLTFSTVLNQQAYDLSAAGTTPVVASSVSRFANERAWIIRQDNTNPRRGAQVFDITSASQPVQLWQYDPEELYNLGIMGQQNSSQLAPSGFAFSSPAGTPTLTLLNPPPASRNMKVRMHLPQDDLATVTDVMLVPFSPVVLLATAYAFGERGEELGPNGGLWTSRAAAALQLAIDQDTPDEARVYYAD